MVWFNCRAFLTVWRRPATFYHANDLDTLPAGVLLSRLHKASLMYDSHELFVDQFSESSVQFRSILFGLEHWLIRYASKVVTVNQTIAEILASRHAVPLPTVVMNCPFARPVAAPIIRLSAEPVVRVIYQGVFREERGLEQLVRSAAWYHESELFLRGYGDLEDMLRALVKAEGLAGRVHFLAPVLPQDMVEGLAGFQIGVVAYRPTTLNHRFCLPNKIFEYLHAGLALAVSALPELERVVKDTAAGEVFNSEDPKDIARAINALTASPTRLRELQAHALAAGRERYTWEVQGEPRLLACYREMAGELRLG
jgi:glycosyltransferase involved in cell wall biosynthesis